MHKKRRREISAACCMVDVKRKRWGNASSWIQSPPTILYHKQLRKVKKKFQDIKIEPIAGTPNGKPSYGTVADIGSNISISDLHALVKKNRSTKASELTSPIDDSYSNSAPTSSIHQSTTKSQEK